MVEIFPISSLCAEVSQDIQPLYLERTMNYFHFLYALPSPYIYRMTCFGFRLVKTSSTTSDASVFLYFIYFFPLHVIAIVTTVSVVLLELTLSPPDPQQIILS